MRMRSTLCLASALLACTALSATAAPRVASVTVGPQVGSATYGTSTSITYLVTVTRGGFGNFTVTMSMNPPLPAGLTASFSPNPFLFPIASPPLETTLTITTTSASPASLTGFTVQAQTGGATSTDLATNTGTLTVSKAPLTVTADDRSKTYGGADPALTQTPSGTLYNGDTFAVITGVSLSTATGAAATAGTHPITASGGTADNYEVTHVAGTLTVSKAAALTATADDQAKTYGDADPVLTYATSGTLYYGDSFAVITGVSLSAATGAAATAGTHTITASGGSADNYDVTHVAGTLTVSKAAALTATADDQAKTYGDADPVLTYATSGTLYYGDTFAVITGVSLSAATGAAATAGTHTITAAGGTAANYFVVTANGTLTVGVATLTVTANSTTKSFGTTLVFGGTEFTTLGLKYTDAVTTASLMSAGSVSGAGVAPYPITLAAAIGSGLDNYTIGYVDGVLTVTATPATASVVVSPNPLQYSDLVTFTGLITGGVAGGQNAAGTLRVYIGTQELGTITLAPSGTTLTGMLTVALLEPTPFGTAPTGQLAPGARTVSAVIDDPNPNFALTAPAPSTLIVTAEDARAAYSGSMFATTADQSSSTATVTLRATIQDITAAGGDAGPGDIRNARVTFVNRDNNTVIASNLTPVLVNAGDVETGIATYNWNVNVGANNSQSYTVGV